MGVRALFVQQVSQDFSGHNKDLCVRTEFDIARHDADGGFTKVLRQICELLIRQRLDGGRIEDAIAVFEMVVNRKFTGLSFA
jgi:hypothetical protein